MNQEASKRVRSPLGSVAHEQVVQDPVLRVCQSKAQTKAFYDRICQVYDLLAEAGEAPIRRAGVGRLAVQPRESVLEVGFGTGHSLVDLARAVGPNGKVYGIDLSTEMRKVAWQRLENAGLADRVELRCGNATWLPYRSCSMNAVFMSFTLELFDTPEIPNVLGECMRTLKRGGRTVVVGMSKQAGQGLAVRTFEWAHRHFPGLLDCRPIYVRRALEESGFLVEETAIERIWIPVEIVLARKPSGEPISPTTRWLKHSKNEVRLHSK